MAVQGLSCCLITQCQKMFDRTVFFMVVRAGADQEEAEN